MNETVSEKWKKENFQIEHQKLTIPRYDLVCLLKSIESFIDQRYKIDWIAIDFRNIVFD